MKRVLTLMLAALLVFGLTACAGTPTTTVQPEATVKTGFGVVFSNSNSKDPADGEDGTIDTQAYAAAVMVDKDGKIVKCVIDAMQSKFTFTAESEIKTDAGTVFKTKTQLGDAYGMKGTSGITKEWYEQAAAFAAYAVGKTAAQIEGIAVADGIATDPDLTSSVTVHIAPFQNSVLKALANAKDLGAKATDKLGLAIEGTAAQTVQKATDDGPATAVAYNYYAAVTFDAAGKITSCIIDASQAKFAVENGKIATALDAEIKTKNELGDAYGMKNASTIKKEWYEQAAAFAAYAVGKTAADIKGIALSEGKPADADLASSVTVHVTSFINIIDMAAATAK
ncbi:MAG TPA: hypothetical protein DD640_09390 [Clostridiales bacterium]|nr:hypothetical protein [Clostridiales bacterium]